jgi:hypothetical protein
MQTVSFLFLPGLDIVTFQKDSVPFEQLEFIHLSLGHFNNRIVIVFGVLHGQLVGSLLFIKDRSGKVFFLSVGLQILTQPFLSKFNRKEFGQLKYRRD